MMPCAKRLLTLVAAIALAVPAIYLVLPTRAPVPVPGHARVPASGPASRDLFAFLLAHSRDLGPLAPTRPVAFLLLLRDGTAAKQAADLAARYRPHSPTFGHFLSVRQLEAAYGPPAAAVARLRARLARAGLARPWLPINRRLITPCYGGRWSVDWGPREGTERMGAEDPVRAATLSVIARLWSADGTGFLLRGEVEHVRTGERRFFATYGMLVDATNGSARRAPPSSGAYKARRLRREGTDRLNTICHHGGLARAGPSPIAKEAVILPAVAGPGVEERAKVMPLAVP